MVARFILVQLKSSFQSLMHDGLHNHFEISVKDEHGYLPCVVVTKPVLLPSFVTSHRICSKNDTTCATSGEGTAYSSRTAEFNPGF